jgi:hypothetical protein
MEVSAQLHVPAALSPKKQPSGTHCMWGCVSPRAGVDFMEKRNISWAYRKSNPNTSVLQPAAKSLYWLSYPGSQTHVMSPTAI